MGMLLVVNGNKIQKIKTGGQYDGEKIPGDLSGWDVLNTDPNQILTSTFGHLQKRSMTLYHTYPPARSAINKQIDYAVGPGRVFRSQPDYRMLGKPKEWAKDWGKDFQKIVLFYFQKLNFLQKQSILMRGAMTIGDSCLLFLRDNGYLSDLIEFGGDDIDWEAKSDGHTLGVKHDEYKRKTGLKLTNGETPRFVDTAGNQNIIQFMFKELPRQLRGYPLIYSIINFAKQDDRHWDATAKRAVMEAIIMASSKTGETDISEQLNNADDIGEENKRGGPFTRILARFGSKQIQPGTVLNFGTNKEGWEFHDIKTPGNTFDAFKHWGIRYTGMATGTPPEVIMSEYSTSYTAHKGAFNDFKKSYDGKARVLEDIAIRPVIREIAKDAIMRGYISAPGFFTDELVQWAYLQGMTLGPVPGTINPLQEASANEKNVKNAFQLRSDVAALFGNEWDNFIEEWADEQEAYNKMSPDVQAALIQQQEQQNNQNQQGGNQ